MLLCLTPLFLKLWQNVVLPHTGHVQHSWTRWKILCVEGRENFYANTAFYSPNRLGATRREEHVFEDIGGGLNVACERPRRTSQTSRSQPNQPAAVSIRTFKMSHKQANCFGELFQKNAIAITSIHLLKSLGDFPGRPVVMTPRSQCRGHGWFDPRSGEPRSCMLRGTDRKEKSLETMTFNEGSEKMGQETG